MNRRHPGLNIFRWIQRIGGPIAIVIIGLSFLFQTTSGITASMIRTETKFGLVEGKLTQSSRGRLVANFLGIPYALPPTDERRFKDPLPWNYTWDSPYYALSDSLMCAQQDLKGNIFGSEDCLYLNVFVPLISGELNADHKLPVMVFVHGGAFNTGSSDSSKFAPEYLMDQNVVLVTLNYRLNVLGFYSTGNRASPGNYGVKDIVIALQWVQENIANFDGDPNSVTLWGQSAGAAATHFLALTPKTEGLFHRYILHSGSAMAPWSLHPKHVIRKASLDMATILGCRRKPGNRTNPKEPLTVTLDYYYDYALDEPSKLVGTDEEIEEDEETMNCMRELPAKKIMKANDYFHFWRRNPWCIFGPTIEDETENSVITMHPITALRKHLFRDIPWIIGVVRDEGLVKTQIFYHMEDVEEEVRENFETYLPYFTEHQELVTNSTAFADAIKDFYFGGNITENLRSNITELVGDALITWPTYQALTHQSQVMNSSTYFFYFTYEGTFTQTFSSGIPSRYGIAHGDDLNYLFPIWNRMFADENLHNTEDDTTVINIMTEMWAHFAAEGVPKAWMTPQWPDYGKTHKFLRFGDGGSADILVDDDFLPDRMTFWQNLTEELSLTHMEVSLSETSPSEPDHAVMIHGNVLLFSVLMTIVAYVTVL